MGLRAWLQKPITVDPDMGTRSIEVIGRASVGLRPPTDRAGQAGRSGQRSVVMPRWRLLVPVLAGLLGAFAILAAGAFLLIYFR